MDLSTVVVPLALFIRPAPPDPESAIIKARASAQVQVVRANAFVVCRRLPFLCRSLKPLENYKYLVLPPELPLLLSFFLHPSAGALHVSVRRNPRSCFC